MLKISCKTDGSISDHFYKRKYRFYAIIKIPLKVNN